jgi:hypothetical protein
MFNKFSPIPVFVPMVYTPNIRRPRSNTFSYASDLNPSAPSFKPPFHPNTFNNLNKMTRNRTYSDPKHVNEYVKKQEDTAKKQEDTAKKQEDTAKKQEEINKMLFQYESYTSWNKEKDILPKERRPVNFTFYRKGWKILSPDQYSFVDVKDTGELIFYPPAKRFIPGFMYLRSILKKIHFMCLSINFNFMNENIKTKSPIIMDPYEISWTIQIVLYAAHYSGDSCVTNNSGKFELDRMQLALLISKALDRSAHCNKNKYAIRKAFCDRLFRRI